MKGVMRWWFLLLYASFVGSLIYVVWNWPYTPADAISDLEKIGPLAFICDVFFIIPIIYLVKKWREDKPKALSMSADDGELNR